MCQLEHIHSRYIENINLLYKCLICLVWCVVIIELKLPLALANNTQIRSSRFVCRGPV